MGTPLRGALKGGRSLRSTAYVLNRLDAICAIYGPAKRIVLAMLEYFGHRGFYADKEPVHGFVLLARAPLQLKLHPSASPLVPAVRLAMARGEQEPSRLACWK